MSTPHKTDDDQRISSPEPDGPEDSGKPTGPQRKAVKLGLALTLLLAGSILTSLLPLPFVVVSGVLALAAIVCGIMCIVTGVRAGQAAQAVVTGVIGILVAGYVLASAASTAAIWPVRQAYEDCVAEAITERAQATCQNEYNTAVGDWFEGLTGQPLPGSGG